jgi:hypothetical protein
MIEKEIVEAHALENAISHNGKAASGSVLNALFAEGLFTHCALMDKFPKQARSRKK